ncbi:MAG: glycosyltransferase [Candidatus Saccharimonadales bacterium]|jgi:glycosyltransferase involved in cell wall biosynthesis
MAKPPIVSVVIPAYNEATYIDRLLEALARQNFKDFEMIVSDAQSNDGTEEVVDSFKDKLDIKFTEAPPKGPGHGRNVGAKLARGGWLLFLDADDDIDDPNFIETLLSETKKHGWSTSSARMRVKANFVARLGTANLYHYQKLLAHTRHPIAQGYCIFTKRDVFEDNNGFNEKIHYGEDNDYVSRAAKHGFGFVDNTYYYVDLRRNQQEGIIRFALKNIAHEVYRLTHLDDLEGQPFRYEFGKHKKRGN